MAYIKLVPSRNARIVLIATPLVVPFIYLAFLAYNVSRKTKSSSGIRRPKKGSKPLIQSHGVDEDAMPWKPVSLPDDVKSDDSDWILAYERATSLPVPLGSLAVSIADSIGVSPSPLLRAYTSGAHIAFSSTPQAILIRALVDPPVKPTFETSWIESLNFEVGDVVNGVYKVTYCGRGQELGSERIELAIQAPPSYKGPVPNGLIVSEMVLAEGASLGSFTDASSQGDHVIFVNETWMWRRETEKPTLVESKSGGWMHSLMAGWLIHRGMKAVSL